MSSAVTLSDEFHDGLSESANIICICDGCNPYSPTYKSNRECDLHALVRAEVARGAQRVRDAAGDLVDGGEWEHGLSCASWYADNDCNCWQAALAAALSSGAEKKGLTDV